MCLGLLLFVQYGLNIACSVIITAPGSLVTLAFTAFRTEAVRDPVTIYAGDSAASGRLLAVLSGSPALGVYRADVANLFVLFISDESVSLSGFTATLSSTPILTSYLTSNCPTVTPTNVSVASPFNDLAVTSATQYGNNMNCSVVLVSPLATVVTLTLTRWVDTRARLASSDRCCEEVVWTQARS